MLTVGPDDLDSRLNNVLHDALTHPGLALIVVRTRCDRPPRGSKDVDHGLEGG